MTVKTRAELKAENAADFPDNSDHQISAADLRGQMDDVVDSALLREDLPGLDVSPASVTATAGATKTLAAWTADIASSGGANVSDAAYDATAWDGVTNVAPSKNAVRDKFVAVDAAIAGGGGGSVSDAAYDETAWDGVAGVAPSKNAVRDKFVAVDAAIAASGVSSISDVAYNATTWDGVTTIAPSKNAVRDKFAAVDAAISGVVSGGAVSNTPYDAVLWDGATTVAPSQNAVRDKLVSMEPDAEDVSYARFAAERRNRGANLPKALVLVLIGQSNNTSMNTQISTVVSQDAYMPVGGNARQIDGTFHGSFFASAVVHSEGFPGETPISGIITTLMGGNFSRMYAVTVAVGGQTLDQLFSSTIRCDLYAALFRLCDLARAAGYNPVVVFSTHQGESDAAALNSEATYYADGLRYYGMAQRAAAQAMEQPDYIAPIVFHHPITTEFGTDGAASRDIATGIRRLAKDIPNAIYGGPCYHYNSNSDRTHQSSAGFRTRGEHVGYLLRRYVSESIRELPLEVIDVVLSGTTATVLFNHEVTRDTTVDWGQNLDTANQLGGFEWVDNGTLIKITAMTVQGRKVLLTLFSTPVGTIGQQRLRVALQTITSSPATGSSNRAGSQMRVNETGRAAIYSYGDVLYGTHHRWAIPQLCSVRAP